MTPAAGARDSSFGLPTAVSLVMGNMIGSGVFLLPAALAPYGGLSFAGWLVSAGGATLLALVFARLARAAPAAGGPYAYTRQAFGDLAGFLVAWGYWISIWCGTAAIAVAFVGYLDPFFPGVVRTPVLAALAAIGTVWLLTGVNIRGVAAAGAVQLATTILKVLPLAFVGIGGLALFEPAHFAAPGATTGGLGTAVTATATLTLWAFLGLECATIPAGEVRDPHRTIPRATIIGTLLAAAIYIVSTAGVMSLVSPAVLAGSTAPFADAARALAGDGAAVLVAAGAAISCFGALNGWILIVGQLTKATAEDGLFPRVFARTSSRGTPAHGMVIAGVLTSTLIAMNYSQGLVELFTFFILLATLATLVPYVFCSVAALVLHRRTAGRGLPAGAAVIAGLAFAYSMWAIGGAGADVVYWGFLLLLAGLPVYAWVGGQHTPRRG